MLSSLMYLEWVIHVLGKKIGFSVVVDFFCVATYNGKTDKLN